MKDSYNFRAIAKKIVAVLEQEEVPIVLIPKVFEAVNDDIVENTIPYRPSCSYIKEAPSKDDAKVKCPIMDGFQHDCERAIEKNKTTHRVIKSDEKFAQGACDNIHGIFARFCNPSSLPRDKK